MKLTHLLFLAALLTASAVHAQNPTPAEIKKAMDYLEKTRADVMASTKGLSEAQWNFKPATNRWSVAEVTEHIAAAEDLLMGNIQTNIMKAPPRKETVDLANQDQFVMTAIEDRSHKAQAPEPLQPDNRFKSPQGSLKHFEQSRAKTIAFVKTTKDLRAHAADSPLGKSLDAYEWVLFIAAHSERHNKQILEVKADPGFPKN